MAVPNRITGRLPAQPVVGPPFHRRPPAAKMAAPHTGGSRSVATAAKMAALHAGKPCPAGALVATIMGNGIYGRLSRVSRLGTYANDLQLGAKWSAEFCHIIWHHAIM